MIKRVKITCDDRKHVNYILLCVVLLGISTTDVLYLKSISGDRRSKTCQEALLIKISFWQKLLSISLRTALFCLHKVALLWGVEAELSQVFFFRFEPENVLDMFLKLYVIVFQQINLDATRLSSTSN